MASCQAADCRADSCGLDHPHAQEPELDVDLGNRSDLLSRPPDRHRHRPGHALHATRGHGVRFSRAHHAERQFRMGIPVYPRQWSLAFLYRRLRPHLSGSLLRFLQGSAGDNLDYRHADLSRDDGDGVHGIRAAMGTDVVLGRDRDHGTLWRHSGRSARSSRNGCWVDPRWTTRRSPGFSACIICFRS